MRKARKEGEATTVRKVADWEPEEALETTASTVAMVVMEAEEMSAAKEVEVKMLQEILIVAMQ